jgi:hypothetical protein
MEHGKMLKLPCYMAKTTLNELHSGGCFDKHEMLSKMNDMVIPDTYG